MNRLHQIISVLFEEGFGVFVNHSEVISHIPFYKRFQVHFSNHGTPKSLCTAFERLGPTFIKLGQMLSMRPDLIPFEYCEALRKLQEDCNPLVYESIKTVVEKELHKPVTKVFKKFSKKPIHAGSLAQVHIATLNKKKVAVKVKRPGVEECMQEDIVILRKLARLLAPKFKELNPIAIVEEFERYTTNELNFLKEAENMERFFENFKDSNNVIIPRVYWKYSTENMLVMEFIEGISLEDRVSLKKHHITTSTIAQLGFKALLKQVFEDGFFHADPHPGNILVVSKKKIAYCDFGIVGELDDTLRHNVILLVAAVINRDMEGIVSFVKSVCVIPPKCNMENLKKDIGKRLDAWYDKPLKKTSYSLFIYNELRTLVSYGIGVPANLILFSKALLTMEGTGRQLDPNFNLIKETKPYLSQLILQEYNPMNLLKRLSGHMRETEDLILTFPKTAQTILERIENNALPQQYEKQHHYDRIRLIYVILFSTLLLFSALILNSSPVLFGMPVYYFSFAFAGLTGLLFIYSFLKP